MKVQIGRAAPERAPRRRGAQTAVSYGVEVGARQPVDADLLEALAAIVADAIVAEIAGDLGGHGHLPPGK